MKKLAILGSTGSIGRTTLDVARHLKERVKVVALAAHRQIDLLELQAHEFHPELIAVFDPQAAEELQRRLPNCEVIPGMEGLVAAAAYGPVDFVVSAISGSLGLEPTLAAIHSGKDVGLANKEALIAGGHLVMQAVSRRGTRLLPIDSEHSAIFQCLKGNVPKSVQRLILTASGGPFHHFSADKLTSVGLADALCHPTWSMGAKITIDSSTLMNKGLEVIEAHWLFGVPAEQIQVVVHPQSIIHSMVEFVDGSLLAQLSEPSMAVPIQYALTYPERLPSFHPPFDLTKMRALELEPPDLKRFPCLRLAYEALVAGGSMPCFMNAANEVLVERFRRGELNWQSIAAGLEELMESHKVFPLSTLMDIHAVEALARAAAAEYSVPSVLV